MQRYRLHSIDNLYQLIRPWLFGMRKEPVYPPVSYKSVRPGTSRAEDVWGWSEGRMATTACDILGCLCGAWRSAWKTHRTALPARSWEEDVACWRRVRRCKHAAGRDRVTRVRWACAILEETCSRRIHRVQWNWAVDTRLQGRCSEGFTCGQLWGFFFIVTFYFLFCNAKDTSGFDNCATFPRRVGGIPPLTTATAKVKNGSVPLVGPQTSV